MPDFPATRRLSGLDKAAAGFLAPAQAADEIGRLGPYRVLKTLGKGGMGMVFKADDPSLQRTVALKIMLPEIAKRGTAKERFLREARAAAAIEHEHIIPIFQVGEDRGIPFIAMSFLKGMNLDDWLKNKPPLSMPQILRIGREIAKGLQAAHDRGLIHRDIKPANLWLDAASKGRIKILDFGLARPEAVDSGITRSGQIVGTPAYMSPEQAAGEKLDARSDLFSLGVVLYRLCTGQLPFRGNNVMGMLLALATEDPDPIAPRNPEVPPALTALIGRLLSKKPQDRPASAKEVVEVIAAIERERMLQKFGAMPTQASVTSESVASPAAAGVGASQAFQFEESSDSFLSEQDFEVARPSKTRSAEDAARQPWLVPVIFAGALAVVVTVVLIAVFFNSGTPPVREEGTVELAADGAQERVILEQDGKIVATLKPSDRLAKLAPGRYVAKLPEGSTLGVQPPNFTLDDGGVVTVRLLPVIPVKDSVKEPKDPVIQPVANSPVEIKPLATFNVGKDIGNLAFTPQGVPITVSAKGGLRTWDPKIPDPLTEWKQVERPQSVAYSRDGKLKAVGGARGVVKLFDQDGKLIKDLEGLKSAVGVLAFSADGKLLAAGSGTSDDREHCMVRVWQLPDGKTIPLGTGYSGTHPHKQLVFSPDGRFLAAGSWSSNAYLWDLQDPTAKSRSFPGQNSVNAVAFAADGKTVFTGCRDNRLRVWNLDGKRLAERNLGFPINFLCLSPDEKTLAVAGEAGEMRLFDPVTFVPVAQLIGVKHSMVSCAFSPDGKKLLAGSHSIASLWDVSAFSGPPPPKN